MRCRYCAHPAGWWKRECSDCTVLHGTFERTHGAPLGVVLEELIGTGIERARIEEFLAADPDGSGTFRDRIVAAAARQLMEAFGRRDLPDANEVGRLRAKGGWIHLGQRPPSEGC